MEINQNKNKLFGLKFILIIAVTLPENDYLK